MFYYNKLFALLALKGKKKTDLIKLAKITSPTLARLSKNEYVSMEVIDRICTALEVQPSDIMDHISMEGDKL